MEDYSLLDRIPLGAFVISSDYRILSWNLCMEGWTDIRGSEAVGRDLRELFPKFRDSAIASRIETVLKGGPPIVLSYQLHGDILPRRQPTLVPRLRQCMASALPSIGGALFSVEDRTDIAARSREARIELTRREAVERELRRAVDEKEMLMRELKHRIKNNLNMVQSLIGLESSFLPAGPARERLDDLEARVNSIASLYDNLYQSRAGSEVAADEYLSSIALHLFSAFAGTPDGPSLALELEKLQLPADGILYLGLAVNELLTNAIKYGGKRIALSLASDQGGVVEVTVRDDGRGFPTPIPMKPESLGLRLVMMLADQMGGSLETDGSDGGLFRLRMPPACASSRGLQYR
jgi:two-component sensor histidine kinase